MANRIRAVVRKSTRTIRTGITARPTRSGYFRRSGRLAVVVGITLPAPNHQKRQKRADHNEDRGRYLHHKKRQMMDHLRRTGVGIERARRLVDDAVGRARPRLRAQRSLAGAATHKRLARAFALQPSSKHLEDPPPLKRKTIVALSTGRPYEYFAAPEFLRSGPLMLENVKWALVTLAEISA